MRTAGFQRQARRLGQRQHARTVRERKEPLLVCRTVCLGNGKIRPFGLPGDVGDPPPVLLEKQLDAVDAALERRFVIGIVVRVIRAERVHEIAVAVLCARRLAFVEAVLIEIRSGRLDELLRS